MKKILFIPIIVLFIILGSCSDNFMDTAPFSSVASENMWSTENLTDLGVLGVYQALRTTEIASTNQASGYNLYQTDGYSYIGQGTAPVVLCGGTITPQDALFSTIWQSMFEGVHRSNDAIKNIPLKSPAPNNKKARYIAECKFLRAYFYFRLNQTFKGVPVYLEPISDDECVRSQETEDAVWAVILKDLTDCINEPELPNKYKAGVSDYGHVTKGAAYALRGKAYMYKKEWAKAAADFAKVGECGYKLFQGGYKELFLEANEQCDEMVFTMQNVMLWDLGLSTQFYCGSRSSFGSNWNAFMPSPNLVDLYENKDGSPFNWNDIIPGYNEMTPDKREAYFLRDDLSTKESTAAVTRGADISVYLPGKNEARIKKAYEGRDPRLQANVITPYTTFLGALSGQEHQVTMRWPYRNEAIGTNDLRSNNTSQFFYLYRKYVYEGISMSDRRNGPTDFPIIRYADVVLMWAEALVELNDPNGAIGLINQVRGRTRVEIAPLQNTNASLPTYVKNQDDLRTRVRNERRVEFPNEGINYFDELRWGTLKNMVFKPGNGITYIWGTVGAAYVYLGDQLNQWPVPMVEVEKNTNLIKTPGWIY